MEESRSSEESQYVTSFYRYVMPSVVRDRKMVLPKQFVEEYGDELSRAIRLKLGVGDIWHISLKKSGCLIWLNEGLDKFMKHFSVGFGYVLLFKYKGNRDFYLHIFDLTATEIDYELRFNSKRFEKEEIKSSMTVKKLKHSSNVHSEKETPLHKANMYRTDYPSCVLQMKEYSLKKHILFLPTQFCKEHKRNFGVDMKIQDSEDMTWHVSCSVNDSRWTLSRGWSQYAKAKRLQVGDVCVFETVGKGIMKVHVFHAK